MAKQLLSILMLTALLFTGVSTSYARNVPPDPESPAPPQICDVAAGACQTEEGLWYMPEGAQDPTRMHMLAPQATGGPDDYGYTWNDSVAMNWINATGGTNTGLSHSSGWASVTEAIPLGFQFKFYENSYTSIYISSAGAVGFDRDSLRNTSTTGYVPSPSSPNNFIAPYLAPLRVNAPGYSGNVYYLRGGTQPNRYLVVEWHQVNDDLGGSFTFQVILNENGNIRFQYLNMKRGSGFYCSTFAGIEDAAGLIGLAYRQSACNNMDHVSGKAVLFNRPAPSARASVRPAHQGRFVRAGEVATFEVSIRNTGELGADTYDVTASSTWPISLYMADGVTPLADTNGNGRVDTGILTQGTGTTIVAKVTTPHTGSAGDANEAALTVQSSVNVNQRKTASLRTGIPAPFAQVFRDNADGAMSLYLAQPGGQSLKKTTGDSHYGYGMAVTETPNSFAYLWDKSRIVNNVWVREIEYALLDSNGNTTRSVSRLTDHSHATVNTYDQTPGVAVAPNGRIGVLWHQYLYNSSNNTINYNIFFAILDSAGNRVYGPVNLTNNNAWGGWSAYGVPRFYYPSITATDDNRFLLAWQRYSRESAGYLQDIYYAVRDTSGGAVRDVSKFTTAVAGGASYSYPALARLSGNRALLAYTAPGNLSYAVLDSAGNTVKGETATGGNGYRPDAVQLANGSVLLAWTAWAADSRQINFAVLAGGAYNVVAGPTALSNPASVNGDADVSVTAGVGHGILTWMDAEGSYRPNLYYALVDNSGRVLTAPMIFRTTQAADPRIETSAAYGNTSYSDRTPPTSQARSHEFATGPFPVAWMGSDIGFGIADYTVQVRDGAGGTWKDWLTNTRALSATYTTVETGHTYYFRSIATDHAGNTQTVIPANGHTHTTIAAYKVEGRVTNNRGQPVFRAAVSAQPAGLNTATSNGTGHYALYFDRSGTHSLTANRTGFGVLPPMHNVVVDTSLSGVDFVLPPAEEAVTNGNWETGDLNGWNVGPGLIASVEITAARTGGFGLNLAAGSEGLMSWSYLTQTVPIPSAWKEATLSFFYRVIQGEPDDAFVVMISNPDRVITHTVSLVPGDWTHTSRSLSDFAGQAVTLQLGFQSQTAGQQIYLDAVSVGETQVGVYSTLMPLIMRIR